jgi:hypothetical protein
MVSKISQNQFIQIFNQWLTSQRLKCTSLDDIKHLYNNFKNDPAIRGYYFGLYLKNNDISKYENTWTPVFYTTTIMPFQDKSYVYYYFGQDYITKKIRKQNINSLLK